MGNNAEGMTPGSKGVDACDKKDRSRMAQRAFTVSGEGEFGREGRDGGGEFVRKVRGKKKTAEPMWPRRS